ncbi:MAG: hypothetical protein IPJ65_43690 [Archangiaceae bacterium]|nr:hypothetical protein [Archangiaceae bacterium]
MHQQRARVGALEARGERVVPAELYPDALGLAGGEDLQPLARLGGAGHHEERRLAHPHQGAAVLEHAQLLAVAAQPEQLAAQGQQALGVFDQKEHERGHLVGVAHEGGLQGRRPARGVVQRAGGGPLGDAGELEVFLLLGPQGDRGLELELSMGGAAKPHRAALHVLGDHAGSQGCDQRFIGGEDECHFRARAYSHSRGVGARARERKPKAAEGCPRWSSTKTFVAGRRVQTRWPRSQGGFVFCGSIAQWSTLADPQCERESDAISRRRSAVTPAACSTCSPKTQRACFAADHCGQQGAELVRARVNERVRP